MKTALLLLLSFAVPIVAQTRELQVYFIDVEGGQATLFLTPTGQSLLIDTGWPGHESRDAKRIAAAAHAAGISKLDYVLLTHYHVDHAGGVRQLAALIPVGTFIDHGPNREPSDKDTNAAYSAYQQLLATRRYKHILARPGDTLPITGLQATVISSDGALLSKPLPRAGQPNDFCKTAPPFPPDATENARSLGIQINFGALRILDLGDLTQDKELQLVCPANRLGREDIYIVSHHGWKQSSNPAFVDAIGPRVAIMDNGETKGGSTPVLDTVLHAPGLETLWQLHYSAEGAEAHNTQPEHIANLAGTDSANYLKLTAHTDGSFDIENSRTQHTQHYPAR